MATVFSKRHAWLWILLFAAGITFVPPAQGEVQETSDQAENARISSQNDIDVSNQLKRQGSIALREGRWNEAAAHFGSALQFAPDDVWSHWQRCWALVNLKQFIAARSNCEAAIDNLPEQVLFEDKPGVSDAAKELIIADYDAAYSALANLLRSQGLSYLFLEQVGELLSDPSLPEDFRRRLESSSRLNLQVAHALADIGEREDALDLFRELETDDNLTEEENASIHLALANIYSQTARSQKAIEYYELLTKRSTSNARYWYLLCSQLLIDDQATAAIEACEKASSIDKSNGLYTLAHGVSLFRAKEYARAKAALVEALKLRPNSSLARRHLFATELSLGHLDFQDISESHGLDEAKAVQELID
ncbi:hypothetical protein ACOTTU_19340 [Roseobacter sp. EG26]|uniref:tetratricopeptide repeat protein n=1 Tax=Roseobacter sp. EG26 TaxID=3412477 RepID=UPI003CE5ACE7